MEVPPTSFPHKEIPIKICRSPDGKTNIQIDHTLMDERKASNMLDVK